MRENDLDRCLFTKPRTQHAYFSASQSVSSPKGPVDPAGRRIDVCDRPLLCSSSNMRNEVVVGSSDHALYAIDVLDPRRSPTTMYTKTSGHTDWVTSVAHLTDGHVLSAAMDGKLCLWSPSNRRACTDLSRTSTHPISKVVADSRYNTAVSCGYDGNIELWSFAESPSGGRASVAQRTTRPTILSGAHTQPVLECAYHQSTLATGDKAGSLVLWDLERATALTRFRAHPSPISALLYEEESQTVVSAGTDGFVKIWDPRASGSGLVAKVLVLSDESNRNTLPNANSSNMNSRNALSSSGAMSSAGRGRGRGISNNNAHTLRDLPQGQAMAGGNPISVLAGLYRRGGQADASHLVVGGGSPSDSRLCFLDARASYSVIETLHHHRNGIYSICVVGEDTVLTGDGTGMLYCQQIGALFTGQALNPRQCIRYGIGATEQGAIRSINCLSDKVVTTGEDGKVLVFDYE